MRSPGMTKLMMFIWRRATHRSASLPWIFVSLVPRPSSLLEARRLPGNAYHFHLAKGDAPQCVATLDFRESLAIRHSPLAIRRAGHWSLSRTASIGKNNLTNVPSAGVGSSQRSMMAILCVLPDKALKMLRRSAFILRARLS